MHFTADGVAKFLDVGGAMVGGAVGSGVRAAGGIATGAVTASAGVFIPGGRAGSESPASGTQLALGVGRGCGCRVHADGSAELASCFCARWDA